MKKLLLFIFLLTASAYSDSISIEECYMLAYQNSPLKKIQNLNEKIYLKKISNLEVGYLPELNFSGFAKYQSDVTSINLNLPLVKLPEIPKDNYQLSLNVNQLIYDGFIIDNQSNLLRNQILVDSIQSEIELYKLKEKINNIYFSLLILKSKNEQLKLTLNDLNVKNNDIESKIKNGIILEVQKKILNSEIIKIQSNIDEINLSIKSLFKVLSELTGKEFDTNSHLKINFDESIINDTNINRLEFDLIDKNKYVLESNKEIINSKYLPKFFAFAQAGYGKPGLNMFETDFNTFWIVGLKASWNLWNWGSYNKDIEIIENQKIILENQKENLKQNFKIASIQEKNEIDKAIISLKNDDILISLKKEILKVSESKFDNGIISGNDYLNDLNSFRQAELLKEIHKIELMKSIYSYKTIIGEK